MAHGARPRPRTAPAAALLLLLAVLAGCGGEVPPPEPRHVDTAALPDEQLRDAVLDECHADLKGSMGCVRAALTFADGEPLRVEARLPDAARVQSRRGVWLVRDGQVSRADGGAADAADAARAQLALLVVDAAALGPVYRATGCRRVGPCEFELAQDDGGGVRLALRPDTLLPAALASAAAVVRFVDYVRPKRAWLVAAAELDGVGRCRITFEDVGMALADAFFQPNGGSTQPANGAQRVTPGAAVESRYRTPTVVDGEALRLVVLPDPRDWPARALAYQPVHAELERQHQRIAGFPQLWRDHGQDWLGVPFRRRIDQPTLQAPDGWQVRDVAAGRWLVVYPATGDVDARAAAGTELLQRALTDRRLTARGPITAQPFVHLEDGVPEPERLADPVVRVAVPIE